MNRCNLRVQPSHVSTLVVPNGCDEDHSLCQVSASHLSAIVLEHRTRSLHLLRHLLESTSVLERRGGSIAVVDGRGVESCALESLLGVLDDLAVLDVETADLVEHTGRGVILGEELCDDSERLQGVDCVVFALTYNLCVRRRASNCTV